MESLLLSVNDRFWQLLERAGEGPYTPMSSLPDPDDDAGWQDLRKRLEAKNK